MSRRFAPDIRAEIDRFVGSGAARKIDFEAVETAVRRCALQLAARAVEQRLDGDHSDDCGPVRSCPDCGQPARCAGRRPKTFETVLGQLTLQRAYYHCRSCGHGCYPRDAALGLAHTGLSPAVLRMTGSTVALVSFAESSARLAELAGVCVDTKQVERRAEALDREVAAAERAGAFPATPASAATMYLGLDGTGLPVRQSEAAECAAYIDNNRARMHYADFRARGLCVASGVVESGCKTVFGTRLKRSGMHWTVPGANAIAALRCCTLSGRYEDFWEYRKDSPDLHPVGLRRSMLTNLRNQTDVVHPPHLA